MENKRVYTVVEVARLLGITPRAVRYMIMRGSLPGTYRLEDTGSSRWRIPAKAVDELINKPKKIE